VPFNTSHARNLAAWAGSAEFPEFRRLVEDIEAVVGPREPAVAPSSAAQQEALQLPPEPTYAHRAPVEQPHYPGGGGEPIAKDAAAPLPLTRPRSSSVVRRSLIGGVVLGVAALVISGVYLRQQASQPESMTEDKVVAAPDLAVAAKREAVSRSAHKPHETFRACPDCPEMVAIPAGRFKMGCLSGKGCYDDELPLRTVAFDKPFAMGKYEVTFADYDRYAAATGRKKPDDYGWGRGKRPVINIDWDEAVDYAK
jgi:hypothetical protein